MTKRSPVASLTDIVEAIELIQSDMAGVALDAFEADRRKRWLVERGADKYLEGQFETRSWDKDGEKRYATEVVLRPYNGELGMLDKAPERPTEQQTSQRQAKPEPRGRR